LQRPIKFLYIPIIKQINRRKEKMENKKTKTFISLPIKENIIDIPIIEETDQYYVDLKKQCEFEDSIFKDISLDNFKKIVKNYIKTNSDTIGLNKK
jgi:hypothetical protein